MSHLRLGFYKGERFTEEPTRRDARPILAALEETGLDVAAAMRVNSSTRDE